LENLIVGQGTINVLISRKNKSLTVEEVEAQVTDRIAQMEIQDQVDALISKSMNSLDFENRMAVLEARTADLEGLSAGLENQFSLIKDDNILEFLRQMNKFNLADISDKMDKVVATGLLEGKLKMADVEAGALAIKTAEDAAPTIGKAIITPAGTVLEDASLSDGKSILIPTKAVSENCKIFTSFENNPGSASWLEKVLDKDTNEYTGFKIMLEKEVNKDVQASWWIVESH
jgi:hypothetical protein